MLQHNPYLTLVVGSPLSGMSIFEVPENLLELIDPANGDKYSPNLHAYLVTREDIRFLGFYKDSKDHLWLGYIDGKAFIGTRLMEVLTQGEKAVSGAYLDLGELNKVEGFWREYIKNGRCAIDPGHTMYFVDDKNRIVNGKCSWCGKVILPEDKLVAEFTRIIPKDNLEALDILSEFKSLKSPSREQIKSFVDRIVKVFPVLVYEEDPIHRERRRIVQETWHPN